MISKSPIEVFRTDKQLQDTLLAWKERLMLGDWTIVAQLKPLDELKIENGLQAVGESEVDFINKNSMIHICDGRERPISAERFCAEEILVHELLHCKYNVIHDDESYEGVMLDVNQHQLLEEMAKSLMMARYDLPFEYWKNPFWNTDLAVEWNKDEYIENKISL